MNKSESAGRGIIKESELFESACGAISKPHIVHVVFWLRVAGLERGVVNLVNSLNARQKHTVVCIADVGALAEYLPPDVEVVDLSRTIGRGRLFPLRLSQTLRKLAPDIVHSRNWAGIDAIPAAWLARVPVRIHGEHGWNAADPGGFNRRRRAVRRLLSPLVDRFVTVSDDLRRWLEEYVGVSRDKVVRIYNGVDVARFSEGDAAAGRRAMGLGDNDVVIGAVGRLDPVKDYQTLLEGFALISDKPSNWKLVVIGDGALRSCLEARVARPDLRGRVVLLGEQTNIPSLMKAMDIFAISSIAEGTSNTVLEAMATGLPIVGTRTGGNPELIVGGSNGYLVPVRDVSGMAKALERYLKGPVLRERHGRVSRKRAVECFSLERMATSYDQLYMSCLQKVGI